MVWRRITGRRWWALLLALALWSGPARAAGSGSLLDFVQRQTALSKADRARWKRAVRRRFGGTALEAETPSRPELGVAKQILAAGIFARAGAKASAKAAWEGWRNTLGYVPPPIAVHYWARALVGRKPKGRPIDLAFDFPRFYDEEIAPDLVEYWQKSLKHKKIPADMRAETRRALAATRKKMRPLLIDKLRLMARLEKELESPELSAEDAAQVRRDLDSLQDELQRVFSGVASSKRVLDGRRSAYSRLGRELKARRKRLSKADRALKPDKKRRRQAARARKKPGKTRSGEDERSVRSKGSKRDRSDQRTDGGKQARSGKKSKRGKQARSGKGAKRAGSGKADKGREAAPASSETDGARKTRLTRAIRPWLGTPYARGRARVGVGTDCSGFTQTLFKTTFQFTLPRVSRDQARIGRRVKRKALRPGDLVFFDTSGQRRVNHVGVYVGGGRFAHASSSRGVRYDKLSSRYYRRAYRGARRVLPRR